MCLSHPGLSEKPADSCRQATLPMARPGASRTALGGESGCAGGRGGARQLSFSADGGT